MLRGTRAPLGRSLSMSKPSFLALDPGLLHPAVALFRDGLLVAASRVRVKKEWASLNVGERCRLIGKAIYGWVLDQRINMEALAIAADAEQEGRMQEAARIRQIEGLSALVVEWPQVYTASKSKGNPNQLVPLAGICMAVAGLLDVPTTAYLPSEWAKQCPKATTGDPLASPRGRKVWGRLSEQERACVVVSHDSIDAAGLGLYYLGRLSNKLYPGST